MEGVRIGIDLGTTNTCCYYEKNGRYELLTDTNSSDRIIPSYVDYRNDGDIIVGQAAKRNNDSSITKSNVLHNTKRAIGRRVCEIRTRMNKEDFGLAPLEGKKKPVFHIAALNKYVKPGDVACEIVKKIIRLAEEQTDKKVSEVCVTVPANFGHNERVATLQAVMSAGIPEEKILLQNEPTAAAICYGVDGTNGNERVLVYDFGGGTFDVSVLEIKDGAFHILSYDGINDLGGADIDSMVMDLLSNKFFLENHMPLFPPSMSEKVRVRHYRKLLAKAEDCKKELQTYERFTFTVPYIGEYKKASGFEDDNEDEIEVVIERSEFESHISDIINDTLNVVDEAIKKANLKTEDIDRVLLVGGSSRLRLVQDMLKQKFGKKISECINPDQCVAKGACMQLVNRLAIHDVLPYSFGKAVMNNGQNSICCLVPCREKLPTQFSIKTQPINDYQKEHNLCIIQGKQEKEMDYQLCDSQNFKVLDVMKFEGFEDKTKEEVEFETTYEVKTNGMLYVSVYETKSNTVVIEKTRYTYIE